MRAAVLLAAVSLARGGLRKHDSRGGDLSEKVDQEGSEDSKASEAVACWCRELEEELGERAREASSEVNFLTTLRSQKHFENAGLRIEVQKHQHEAAQHQQSLDEGGALADAAAADHASDREFHEDALESLGKALDVIPEGTGGEVRGALEALNSSFAGKLREARAAHELRSGAHEDALKAKEEMLRLSREGTAAGQERLHAGEGTEADAGAKLSAYAAQQQADATLRAAAQSLCGTVQDGAQARQQLRQQALIALSQAAVVAAQAVAAKSQAGLVLATAAGERSGAAGLSALVARSSDLESKLALALTTTVSTARAVQMGTLHAESAVKDAIVKVGDKVEGDLQAMQPLFGAVRTAGHKSSEADLALESALASTAL